MNGEGIIALAEAKRPYDVAAIHQMRWETMTFNAFELGSVVAVRNALDVLREGGVVLEEMHPYPWNECGATVIDRYGVSGGSPSDPISEGPNRTKQPRQTGFRSGGAVLVFAVQRASLERFMSVEKLDAEYSTSTYWMPLSWTYCFRDMLLYRRSQRCTSWNCRARKGARESE